MMLICETEAYHSEKSYDVESSKEIQTLFIYPFDEMERDDKYTEQHGRYISSSTDSDSGYSQSCNTPSSSVSEHWEYFNGVDAEDDVFTEKEIVLSYDGSEVEEIRCEGDSLGHRFEETIIQSTENDSGKQFIKRGPVQFKQELDDGSSTVSFTNELAVTLNNDNTISYDVKNININEVNCTDSFLQWLDSDHDPNASPDFNDYYTSRSESNESFNDEDSVDLEVEFPQHTFLQSSTYYSDYYSKTEEAKIVQKLPPIQTMIPAGSKIITSFHSEKVKQTRDSFNELIRGSSTSLHIDNLLLENQENRGGYGHLTCKSFHPSEIDNLSFYGNPSKNQVIISQAKGGFLDDLPCRGSPNSQTSMSSLATDKCLLECRWEDCWAIFPGQAALVRHIEKTHVELRRSDEFACLWQNCPRRTRPFNARYKLLIHMRVHSGEKPNKCPFPGCLKAFSRLENLKIHQRSHTGERPYSCQFPSCMKAFSNSSDRAKHQRTHYDTKPYACQVSGCRKRYTDPSSLRKHIKNHNGTTICKTKKLIASEPLVVISKMEPSQRERLNSFVSDCTSDYHEEEYYPNDSVEEVSDTDVSESLLEFVPYESVKHDVDNAPKISDFGELNDELDIEIEKQFIDDARLDNSNFLTFTDEDMISLLCK